MLILPLPIISFASPPRYACGKYCNAGLLICAVLFAAMQRKHDPMWMPVGAVSWSVAGMGVFYALKVRGGVGVSGSELLADAARPVPLLCAEFPLSVCVCVCLVSTSSARKGREAPHDVQKKDD